MGCACREKQELQEALVAELQRLHQGVVRARGDVCAHTLDALLETRRRLQVVHDNAPAVARACTCSPDVNRIVADSRLARARVLDGSGPTESAVRRAEAPAGPRFSAPAAGSGGGSGGSAGGGAPGPGLGGYTLPYARSGSYDLYHRRPHGLHGGYGGLHGGYGNDPHFADPDDDGDDWMWYRDASGRLRPYSIPRTEEELADRRRQLHGWYRGRRWGPHAWASPATDCCRGRWRDTQHRQACYDSGLYAGSSLC
jgi:hypothetical protein